MVCNCPSWRIRGISGHYAPWFGCGSCKLLIRKGLQHGGKTQKTPPISGRGFLVRFLRCKNHASLIFRWGSTPRPPWYSNMMLFSCQYPILFFFGMVPANSIFYAVTDKPKEKGQPRRIGPILAPVHYPVIVYSSPFIRMRKIRASM